MKNLKTIIKAISHVKNKIPNIRLTIIGDLREENKTLIDKFGLQKNIKFKKKLSRPELISTLKDSDIGISGSLYEGFGFPLIEMISTGLPVITSNRGSLPELAGDSGLTFEANSSTDLSEKIINLIEDNSLREELIFSAKKRRDDFFGWDEYAKKLELIYQNVISGNI